jgi:hypothetical protein
MRYEWGKASCVAIVENKLVCGAKLRSGEPKGGYANGC